MNDMVFFVLVILLSIVILMMSYLVIREKLDTKRHQHDRKWQKPIRYMSTYFDDDKVQWYVYSDDQNLNQSRRILRIKSDRIEYSDDGINGEFEMVWRI